jgi:hypothetical protein
MSNTIRGTKYVREGRRVRREANVRRFVIAEGLGDMDLAQVYEISRQLRIAIGRIMWGVYGW